MASASCTCSCQSGAARGVWYVRELSKLGLHLHLSPATLTKVGLLFLSNTLWRREYCEGRHSGYSSFTIIPFTVRLYEHFMHIMVLPLED